ncbi:MAG: hypothetical protein FRX48_07083 [Lasallia pustulata]|uniref:Uncharacterized protein n=1 Tax=Lasallia pustulata TaxID=136370 RepID=A0A5M8PIK0_9LECA|nr:MAG: hypothetical protein FRX48_07083 [Lasallia pustulata]
MDPLSIAASIVSIATLAGQTGAAFYRLRETCNALPGRLLALANEIADLEAVLREVAHVTRDRSRSRHILDQSSYISQLLTQATSRLTELKDFGENLDKACAQAKIPLVKARAWQKAQSKLLRLQEDIKTIKSSLNVLLGASNSRDMTRICLELESISATATQISAATAQSAAAQNVQRDEHREDSARQEHAIVGTIDKLYKEDVVRNQRDQLASIYGPLPAYRRRRSRTTSSSSDPTKSHKQPNTTESIGLFVGYAGMPLLTLKCDSDACEKAQTPHISLEYWFPMGFVWSQIVRLQLGFLPNVGPQASLSTLRRVPDSAQCVNFALAGNIQGLKELFKNGMASPQDVSSTRGYSLLRWALYGKQYDTVKFLVYAGANPDYRPIAAHDNSPRNKAHDFLHQGGLSREIVDALQCLTAGSDWADEQNFTDLHLVVLGLLGKSLEATLLEDPDDIHTQDAMGRTPLIWAAARGDDRSVATLLAHGADPNVMDVQYTTAVSYAAQQDRGTCVRLLLEAGADPDLEILGGAKVGSALNCASRSATDPSIIKNLLDFGADIESCGVDGKTPLIHVARTDNVSFALLLLEYGANINASSTTEQTPLTTAITFNSHKVLQLLLDRWFEYSECPRLKGPHLLPIVALYADLRSISMLIATDHFKLKYDKKYSTGNFAALLQTRFGSTEELRAAFAELLNVINREPDWKTSAANLMESGLLSAESPSLRSVCSSRASEKYYSHDDADEMFENALEFLAADDDDSPPTGTSEGAGNT